MSNISEIIKLMRPQQYVKNFFVFAPLLFSLQFNPEAFVSVLIAFVFFCLIASSIYVFNDYMDIEEDKLHPEKSKRPLASGTVSKKTATVLLSTISIATLICAHLINQQLFIILTVYFLMNIAYSIKLKQIALVDIFIIAFGFVLRLFAGNSMLESELSMWIIIMTFLLAIFLALAKRRDDVLLLLKGKQTRKNINGYNLEFINASMVLMAGVIIIGYIQYTVSPEVISRLNTEYLFVTAVFVILGILRYMQITFVEEKSGSPTKILLTDKFLQMTIVMWLVSFFVVIK